MSMTANYRRHGGHAPGHYREAFCEAVDAYVGWNEGTEPEPTVEFEERQIPVSRAFKLLWNCSDILPHTVVQELDGCDIRIARNTYGAAAQALHYAMVK